MGRAPGSPVTAPLLPVLVNADPGGGVVVVLVLAISLSPAKASQVIYFLCLQQSKISSATTMGTAVPVLSKALFPKSGVSRNSLLRLLQHFAPSFLLCSWESLGLGWKKEKNGS